MKHFTIRKLKLEAWNRSAKGEGWAGEGGGLLRYTPYHSFPGSSVVFTFLCFVVFKKHPMADIVEVIEKFRCFDEHWGNAGRGQGRVGQNEAGKPFD